MQHSLPTLIPIQHCSTARQLLKAAKSLFPSRSLHEVSFRRVCCSIGGYNCLVDHCEPLKTPKVNRQQPKKLEVIKSKPEDELSEFEADLLRSVVLKSGFGKAKDPSQIGLEQYRVKPRPKKGWKPFLLSVTTARRKPSDPVVEQVD